MRIKNQFHIKGRALNLSLSRLRETAQQLSVAAGLRGKNEQSRGRSP